MPFYQTETTPQTRGPSYVPPPNPFKPSGAEILGAAFRADNPTVNLFRSQMAETFPPDPNGHNPLDVIRGTTYEQQHLDKFIESRSEPETRALMRKIDEEEADRKLLEAAGFPGFVAGVAAGTIDPTIALPAG